VYAGIFEEISLKLTLWEVIMLIRKGTNLGFILIIKKPDAPFMAAVGL
jgi:hypothetical protein